jgi:hypothetical protein
MITRGESISLIGASVRAWRADGRCACDWHPAPDAGGLSRSHVGPMAPWSYGEINIVKFLLCNFRKKRHNLKAG